MLCSLAYSHGFQSHLQLHFAAPSFSLWSSCLSLLLEALLGRTQAFNSANVTVTSTIGINVAFIDKTRSNYAFEKDVGCPMPPLRLHRLLELHLCLVPPRMVSTVLASPIATCTH